MIQRPDDETWAAFVSAIQAAAKLFAEIDARGDGGQAGVMAALVAVEDLLLASGADAAEHIPFLRLRMAFSDLKGGRKVHPIFLPEGAQGRGPNPVASAELVQRAHVAALLESLIRQNEFSTVEEAARWVARKARSLPAFKSGRNRPDAAKVMAWRNDANAGGCNDLDAQVYRAVNAAISKQKPVGRDGVTWWVLEAAKAFGAAER